MHQITESVGCANFLGINEKQYDNQRDITISNVGMMPVLPLKYVFAGVRDTRCTKPTNNNSACSHIGFVGFTSKISTLVIGFLVR